MTSVKLFGQYSATDVLLKGNRTQPREDNTTGLLGNHAEFHDSQECRTIDLCAFSARAVILSLVLKYFLGTQKII